MRLAPSLLPLALLAAGCSNQAQRIGGVPRRGQQPKVVSLSPSTTEIVATNLDARMLVGRTQSDDFPTTVNTIPIVASVKPDFEKIKAQAPNYVVYDADLYSEDDVKRIEGMGAKSYAFKSHTLAGFEKELYGLAGLLGSETTVSAYVDRIERSRSTAEGERPAKIPNVAVILGGDYVAGTDSFVADVVKISGGTPVGPKSEKFEKTSPEALVAAQPDLIILATKKDAAAKDLAAVKANPALAASPAVRNGRISAIDQDVVVRRGSRVDKLIDAMHKEIMLTQEKAK